MERTHWQGKSVEVDALRLLAVDKGRGRTDGRDARERRGRPGRKRSIWRVMGSNFGIFLWLSLCCIPSSIIRLKKINGLVFSSLPVPSGVLFK